LAPILYCLSHVQNIICSKIAIVFPLISDVDDPGMDPSVPAWAREVTGDGPPADNSTSNLDRVLMILRSVVITL
jgi:hypothetical protein